MSVVARLKAEGLQGEVAGADVGGNARLALMARSVMGEPATAGELQIEGLIRVMLQNDAPPCP
jgi:hypothetical protein